MNLEDVVSLIISDLAISDLEHISWSGSATHIIYVRKALERVEKGEVDYLAVRTPDGLPVSIGGVDYKSHENAGTMWQLVTREYLRGLGIGTKLINALEQKIKDRKINLAMVGVEDTNPRARALYEKLGYEVCGEEQDSWEEEDKDGNKVTHHAQVILLKKELK